MIFKSEQAGNDLLDAFTYIGKDNPRAAEHFMDAVEAAIQRLEDLPGLGRVWNSSLARLDGIRCWPIPKFQKYIIFYRQTKSGIDVLRVLHSISMHFWKNNNYSANA
jgi:toxin ParE1/3/4